MDEQVADRHLARDPRSHMRKSGMSSITLSSHLILPWSTSVASAALVNALPVEPVKKIVSASTGWLVVMSRTPHP